MFLSNNNDTLKLLEIKDPNIKILENSLIECKIKNENAFVLQSILSYKPENCYHCYHKTDNKIVFNGFKMVTVKLPPLANGNVYLKLKKQRVLCKHCGRTEHSKIIWITYWITIFI